MPTLIFSDARQINPGRDGMDVEFFYTVDGQDQLQRIHTVGSFNSWNLNDQERFDYAQKLFTSTIAYITRYWQRTGELPKANIEYHERLDLPILTEEKTDWKGYVLNL